MQKSLFDRVFAYAPSSTVLPTENLATEVTAYFLENWPPFLHRFLQGVGVEGSNGTWTVETQRRLYAPGCDWDQKIPDLTLYSRDQLVIVEVKVDAGVTYSGERSQVQFYDDYLRCERNAGRFQSTKLVLLTRWAPDSALLVKDAKSIRFSDVAKWMNACVVNTTSVCPLSKLANDWLRFLQNKRWIMPPLTEKHVDAVKAMSELTAQLWEVLGAAREEIVAALPQWKFMSRTRSSSGSLFGGSVIWAPSLCLAEEPTAAAQVGFFLGEDQGETSIRPLVWFSTALELSASPDFLSSVREDGYGNYVVMLPNLVDRIRSGESAESVWDTAKASLVKPFASFRIKPAACTAIPASDAPDGVS